MSKIYSLTYISTATRTIYEDDLVQILESSRKNNSGLGVTGMLLYKSGLFLQALEGEKQVVTDLYKKIERDERHRSVLTIDRGYIEKRNFGDWSMGFKNLETVDASELDGFNDFFEQPSDFIKADKSPGRALSLLMMFRGR